MSDVGIVGVGAEVVSSSRDGAVRLWDCGTGTSLSLVEVGRGPLGRLALTGPSQKVVAVGTEGGVVGVDLVSGEQVMKRSAGRGGEGEWLCRCGTFPPPLPLQAWG